MNDRLKKWSILGSIVIIFAGILLHFVYEWSGNDSFVGILGAVNESTWEHLKLLFWPSLLFSVVEYFAIGKDYTNYFPAKALTYYVGIYAICTFYYSYVGITKEHNLVVDILIFVVSVIISQYFGYKTMVSDKMIGSIGNTIAMVAIAILIIAFIAFTFNPPRIPMFQDPVTGSYGI